MPRHPDAARAVPPLGQPPRLIRLGVHIRQGLRQAAVMLVLLLVASLVAAAVWMAVAGGSFRNRFGLALMVLGALTAVTGGTEFSRHMTNDARALLGAGPAREVPSSGALTPLGVLLLVVVPAVLGGMTVYERA